MQFKCWINYSYLNCTKVLLTLKFHYIFNKNDTPQKVCFVNANGIFLFIYLSETFYIGKTFVITWKHKVFYSLMKFEYLFAHKFINTRQILFRYINRKVKFNTSIRQMALFHYTNTFTSKLIEYLYYPLA